MGEKTLKHPMQPIVIDESGTPRFHQNAIVRFLIDWSSSRGIDMNTLATLSFSDADREQFSQLIGYSVSGFGELSYVSDEAVSEADKIADELIAKEKKGTYQEQVMIEPTKEQWAEAEKLAKDFHETYERLAPSHGYETRKESAKPWESVPEKNKALMVAVCAEIIERHLATEYARGLEQEKKKIAYWSYVMWSGMLRECPEKKEELRQWLGSLNISPYCVRKVEEEGK